MAIEIREVISKSDQKAFVNVQFDLYKGNPFWIPPMKNDELKALNPETNPAFKFCEAKFWIAVKDGKNVGRIGAIVNIKYIEKVGANIGRFTRLEFADDIDILNALLSTAESWLKEKGMDQVHGPLGFSNLDTQGMLIEGFDHLPSIGSVYHQDYYVSMMQQTDYAKEIDWVEFRLTIPQDSNDKANRGAALIKRRYGIEVLHFTKTSELLPYTEKIFEILNDSFDDLPFVVPFDKEMVAYYREKYIKLLNPEFVKMVKMEDELIGFIIGMPSLSEAMIKAKGKLFPLGFIHLLKALKGKDVMDQMLTGVRKDKQSTGAAVVLMAEVQEVMRAKGMKYIETTGIFETNTNAIKNWKNYDHIQHKRRRCWIKTL